MMKEIDAICRKNDIHYTLGGGTAIGAIRHGGFIPWDDDIDLYMTRENWEKFKVAEKEGKFPANRVLESPETDSRYSNTFGRYVTTDSTAIHSHQIISDDAAGHVLDVFVFDPIHVDNFWKFMEDYQLLSDLMNETIGYSSRFDVNADRYMEYYERTRREGKEPVINELLYNMTHLNDPGWKHYVMEWGTAPFLFPSSIFDGGYTRIPFEDTTVEIVKNYSEYLTWQYGDEWQYIPAHEGREGHDAIFSSKLPYDIVRADYLPFIDKEALHEAYISRKFRLMKANKHRRKSQVASLQSAGKKCVAKLKADMKAQNLKTQDLRKMLENGKYNELAGIFAGYYNKQLSADFAGRHDKHSTLHRYYNPVRIKLSDELFEIAVEVLIRTERMSKAKRLIELYEGYNGEKEMKMGIRDNAKIESLKQEILEARELINQYSIRRTKALYKKVCKYLETYTDNSQIARLRVRMLIENPELEEDGLTIASQIIDQLDDRSLSIISGELEKYRQDIKTYGKELGAEDVEEYKRIYDATGNGFIKLEIEKLLEKNGSKIEKEEEIETESVIVTRKATDYSSKFSFYRMAKNIFIKMAAEDDQVKENAWNIAHRTRDRIVLLEKYESQIDELLKLEHAGRWDELKKIMKAHEEAVLRNYENGLGLYVHPDLHKIQNELFIKSGRAELAEKINSIIPVQHRVPIGR